MTEKQTLNSFSSFVSRICSLQTYIFSQSSFLIIMFFEGQYGGGDMGGRYNRFGRGGYGMMVAPQYVPPPGNVHMVFMSGLDPQCGFQCCCFHIYSEGKKAPIHPALPFNLNGLITLEELNGISTKANIIYDDTSYPACPGM